MAISTFAILDPERMINEAAEVFGITVAQLAINVGYPLHVLRTEPDLLINWLYVNAGIEGLPPFSNFTVLDTQATADALNSVIA